MSKLTIYSLNDPVSNEVRYIGYTSKTLNSRLKSHLGDKEINHRTNWIKSIKPMIPVIREIEDCTNLNWQDREKYWIKLAKQVGCSLTNGTMGGDCGPVGGHTGKKHSEKTKKLLSKIRIGNKMSDITKDKIRDSIINNGKHTTSMKTKRQRKSKHNVIMIMDLFNSGKTVKQISIDLKINYWTIWSIVKVNQ